MDHRVTIELVPHNAVVHHAGDAELHLDEVVKKLTFKKHADSGTKPSYQPEPT